MALNDHLSSLVEEASTSLPSVTRKRMFGCDAYFAKEAIYSLIWKDGRIGLKFPEEKAFGEIRSMPGADDWCPGGKMKMSGWVLVPERFHDDPDELARWTKVAHGFAMKAPPKKAKAAKKAPSKKKAPPARKR